MRSRDCLLRIDAGTGPRLVALADYLDPEVRETAEREANAWIKRLRHAHVDGRPLRERFTYRGDSLWWFAELYLHKRRTIVSALQVLLAFETMLGRERPIMIELVSGDRIARGVAPQVARRRRIAYHGPKGFGRFSPAGRWGLALQSAWYAAGAATAHVRVTPPPATDRQADVVAFVHSAFWRSEAGDALMDQEGYIGPVLRVLADRVGHERLHLVGLGPRSSFRARGWRARLAEMRDRTRRFPFTPVEAYAAWQDIRGSRQLWRTRRAVRRALCASNHVRDASVVRGCDLWPLVQEELAGIASLQFPWSARAMDEAAAALDCLRPRAIVTYAEAGGWGRALILEARRRGIPVAGLQHGFIYRHWLNYLHEPDELLPAAGNSDDRGFPRPDVTLVYDEYTAQHLTHAGRFPRQLVCVTGSPRLDALMETARRLGPAEIMSARSALGARADQHLLILATKFAQVGPALGPLIAAIRSMPDVHLVIKPHPAETASPYQRAIRGLQNIVVAPAAIGLAQLLASARLVVTVNSTVAIDAMVLGVPTLAVLLPNNLSPLVDAGAIAGATAPEEIGSCLHALLYDETFRARLARDARDFMARQEIGADGQAAQRSADTILALAGTDVQSTAASALR